MENPTVSSAETAIQPMAVNTPEVTTVSSQYPVMADQSDPGTSDIPEKITGFYFGGNTPHVWTRQQIDRQSARYMNPIWVYGKVSGYEGGQYEAGLAVKACRALGIPYGVRISVDMEDTQDFEYTNGFHDVIKSSGGYWTGLYGSRDTIVNFPLFGGGKWVADWTGQAHFSGMAGEWACQYASARMIGKPYDVSLVRNTTLLWDRTYREPASVITASKDLTMAMGLIQTSLTVLNTQP